MTMREFLRSNRTEIDAAIDAALDYVPASASCHCHLSGTAHRHESNRRHNDEERRGWVVNDEYLYMLARRAGVRV